MGSSETGKTIGLNHKSLHFYGGSICYSAWISTKLELKNYTGNGKIQWKTSNSRIVKVDQDGNVSSVAYGKATVTATCEGKTYKCKVTYKE
ncbi:MAG: Ig-like domain-containing protein [Eubacterium sp.]|nr:Ig-like domain-containing protein [Eubacterium sp.]